MAIYIYVPLALPKTVRKIGIVSFFSKLRVCDLSRKQMALCDSSARRCSVRHRVISRRHKVTNPSLWYHCLKSLIMSKTNYRHEEYCLLECNAFQSGRSSPTFRRNALPSSSEGKVSYSENVVLFCENLTSNLSPRLQPLSPYLNNLQVIFCTIILIEA
jgi:hypothetical protein